MNPTLVLPLWLILFLALVRLDPAREPGVSFALWVPFIWMFVVASRLPSQWLGGGQIQVAAQALEEGNPLDRAFYFLLIGLSIWILASRSFKWADFFARNSALVTFISFALISVVWSDFPLVAFKRWFRDLGNYLVILVVLSDPRPLEAVRTVLRRLCFLLVSLSIVLIKYYPELGTQYTFWGERTLVGVTTAKNLLGVVYLISGIFFFWDTMTRWPDRKDRRTKKIILLNLTFIGMTLWLLSICNSATSRVCLVIGCAVICAAQAKWGRRHAWFIKVLIPASFCLYLILAFGLDLNGELASQVGRDPTFTDRTLIWKSVLSIDMSPLIGAGYESFWLGPQLKSIWRVLGGINEAHNGYLEVYLNQGLIGVFLLGGLLIASYRTICRGFTTSSSLASLNLALWAIVLFYNMTEAAFKVHPVWLMFLLGAMAAPARVERDC